MSQFEPIKIRWIGDARLKFETREIEPREGTEGMRETAKKARRCIMRQKTNIVVTTPDEAEAMIECLEAFSDFCGPYGAAWSTSAHKRAVERVLGELKDEYEK